VAGATGLEPATSCVNGVGSAAPKAEVLPLGSPSFSMLPLKVNDLVKNFGSGTVYENVAPHAWSPPNFPHGESQPKARPSVSKDIALQHYRGHITSNPAHTSNSIPIGVE
jgi:hypothetical protein